MDAFENGSKQTRIGLALEGRMPAREGAQIYAGEKPVGTVTSGGFSPTLGHPIAMGYVDSAYAALDDPAADLTIAVRNKHLPAKVTAMPFVPHRYYRGST